MKHFIILALLLISGNAISQNYTELRPEWVKSTPVPPTGANYFLNWGMGEGNNEQEATNAAWADVLRKSLHELGLVGITQQDINAVANNGINAVVKFNQVKRRIVSSTEPIQLGNKVKIYILIQVQRNVNGQNDFYTLNTAYFKDAALDKQIKNYNAQFTGNYPFSARVFVPGMAQLHKGSTAKGLFFIISEAACVGGIVAAECLRADYMSKYKATNDAYKKSVYWDRTSNWENIRNGAIAGAAVFYVWNVIDGIAAKGKKRSISLGDAQLHINPYATPQTGGLSLALNF